MLHKVGIVSRPTILFNGSTILNFFCSVNFSLFFPHIFVKLLVGQPTSSFIYSKQAKLNSFGFIYRKSREYLRLLQLKKRGAGLVNLNDSCAIVICINLAADNLGCSFDKVSFIIYFYIKLCMTPCHCMLIILSLLQLFYQGTTLLCRQA